MLRALADAVVVVHLGFIVFVAAGSVLAWRWPRLVWLHVPALAWSVATLAVGLACPLTALEKGLRRLAGDGGYGGGFVDRYVEDVVYPDEYTGLLRAAAAALVVAGYAGLARRRRARAQAGGSGTRHSTTVPVPVPAESWRLPPRRSARARMLSRP